MSGGEFFLAATSIFHKDQALFGSELLHHIEHSDQKITMKQTRDFSIQKRARIKYLYLACRRLFLLKDQFNHFFINTNSLLHCFFNAFLNRDYVASQTVALTQTCCQ